MKNITTDYTQPTALVEENPYDNNNQAPIYLLLDWENETIDVDTYYELHSVPMDIHHKLRTRIRLPPNLNASYIREEIDELIPLINEISSGYSSEWNGHNWVGTYTANSSNALDDLIYTIDTIPERYFTLCCDLGLWDAAEWFQNPVPELTPNTTPDELTELASYYYDYALADYAVIKGGQAAIRRHFQDLIDEMIDTMIESETGDLS